MSVMDTAWGRDYLMRNEVFSSQIKEIFKDEVYARQWVNMINELPDGENLKINSFGELSMADVAESTVTPSSRMDLGQYIFNITEYKGVKIDYTDEFLEEDFMAPQAVAQTAERMMRAFDVQFETDVMKTINSDIDGQTKNDSNVYGGRRHRIVGNGTNRQLSLADFAYAKQALKKARVPMNNLIAVVDPSVEFYLDTLSNIVDISNNPQWEGIVETGIGSGTRFIRNIYGFDVYTSDFLDEYVSGESSLTDYEGNTTAPVAGDKMGLFFTAAQGASPFIGAFRRNPTVKSWRDEAILTEYHEMRTKYGLGLYRPEAIVGVWHSDALSA